MWSDAAPSEGMCYILAQYKDPENPKLGVDIISCDSTTFKRGKRSLSPFEAELAGVHWALTKGTTSLVVLQESWSTAMLRA